MPIAVLNLDNRGQATGTLFWHTQAIITARLEVSRLRECGCLDTAAVPVRSSSDPTTVGLVIVSRTFGPISRTSVGYSENAQTISDQKMRHKWCIKAIRSGFVVDTPVALLFELRYDEAAGMFTTSA